MSVELERAAEQAAVTTGLSIPIRHSAVADCPWHFEDRLERQLPDLHRLEVWILEKHDLALSKSVRGDAHDEQQLVGMHRENQLDYDVLVQRFRDEMTHVVGDAGKIRTQFLDLVELLFGEVRRIAAAKALAGR